MSAQRQCLCGRTTQRSARRLTEKPVDAAPLEGDERASIDVPVVLAIVVISCDAGGISKRAVPAACTVTTIPPSIQNKNRTKKIVKRVVGCGANKLRA